MKQSVDAARWVAVENRDHGADGRFVYAVTTTGVFCRPSCPSRRPKRSNVHFYSSAGDAEKAGFRACRRCKPKNQFGNLAERAVAVAKAIMDSGDEEGAGMDLKSLARKGGVSPFHLQRHFKRIVGMTPKAYLTKTRSTELRKNLRAGVSVLRATYESGFNSPSRAYAAAGAELGMTPSAYRKQGEGVEISYSISKTALGRVIVGVTQRGVCAVMIGQSDAELLSQLRAEFPRAALRKGSFQKAKLLQR